jgi:phage terminase Nu1 subunit (DNA packaging protein)
MAVIKIATRTARLANKAQVAEFFEVSVNAVDGWIRRGCPYVRRGDLRTPWVFDLLKVLEWRFTQPQLERCDDPEAMSPLDRRDWYEGERVREKIEELRANLISRDEFDAEKSRIQSAIAGCLDRLPDRLITACKLPPAASATLREMLDRECSAMTMTP